MHRKRRIAAPRASAPFLESEAGTQASSNCRSTVPLTRWTSIRRRRFSTCCATISTCTGRASAAGWASAARARVIIDGVAIRSCITPVSAVKRRGHHARRPREGRQAASAAAGLDRRAGGAVRLLPERPDHERPRRCSTAIRTRAMPRSASAMEGALCRCMTYYRIQAAIKRVVRGTTWPGKAQVSAALQLPEGGGGRAPRAQSDLAPRVSSRLPARWSSA